MGAREGLVSGTERSTKITKYLFEVRKPFSRWWKGKPERLVFGLHPSSPHAKVEPPSRHLIDGGGGLGDHSRVEERNRCDEDAEPDV